MNWRENWKEILLRTVSYILVAALASGITMLLLGQNTKLAQLEQVLRHRFVGPMDLVATRYGAQTQGATKLALTKLDVLSDMEQIPVCTKYELNGEVTDRFPFPTALPDAKPVVEYLEGWKCDISKIRTWEKLPSAARAYVRYIEEQVGCPIEYISVGPEREAYIKR